MSLLFTHSLLFHPSSAAAILYTLAIHFCPTFFSIHFLYQMKKWEIEPISTPLTTYVYHSTGLVATSYFRTLGVPCSQYIDDRHVQASLWRFGNQPLQFGLTLNWPRPLLLFWFQFSLHWVIRSRCLNRLLSHPSVSVSLVTSQILF